MKLFYEDEHISIKYEFCNSDTTYFSFTGVGLALGGISAKDVQKEEFKKSLSNNQSNSVYVIDKKRSWYSSPQVDAQIKRFVSEVHDSWAVERIVTLGNSMGGTGAIKYGAMLGAFNILSFCPQSSVAPRIVPFENRYNRYVKNFPDNYDFYDAAKPNESITPIILYGMDAAIDVKHARRMFKAGFKPIIVMNAAHEVAKKVKSYGMLSELVDGISHTPAHELIERCIEKLQCIPFDRLEEFFIHYKALHSGKDATVEQKMEALNFIIDSVGPNAKLYFRIGKLHKTQRNLAEAQKYFLKAIETDPTLPAPYMHLSQICNQQGNRPQAMTWVRKALELNKENPYFYNHFGNLLRADGANDEAMKAHKKALELKEDLAGSHFQLSHLYLAQNDEKRALEYAGAAVSHNSKNPNFLKHFGKLLYSAGDLNRAYDTFLQLIDIDDKNPGYHLHLSRLHAKRGEFEKAIKSAAKALSLKKDKSTLMYFKKLTKKSSRN